MRIWGIIEINGLVNMIGVKGFVGVMNVCIYVIIFYVFLIIVLLCGFKIMVVRIIVMWIVVIFNFGNGMYLKNGIIFWMIMIVISIVNILIW